MDLLNVWPGWIAESTPIGRGSYGTVYRCYTETDGLRRYSAVKVISVPQEGYEMFAPERAEMSAEQTEEYYKEIVDEFLNEIKLLESLRGSKNIVDIEDYSVIKKENGVGWDIYIRMELLTDFGTYFSQHEMNTESAVKLGLDICSALKTCREKKIIHRDIKPENIFADDEGNFKLGDFGVARQMEKTEASMSRKGTYNYMAPEVFYSEKYDSRADIYSTGIVMYKMLNNNRLPFIDTKKQIILHNEREEAFNRRIKGETIPPIEGVDENLNSVILKACAYKAEDRFRTIDEFESALRVVQSGGKVRAKKANGRVARRKWLSVVAAVLILAIVSGTAFYIFNNKNKDHPEESAISADSPEDEKQTTVYVDASNDENQEGTEKSESEEKSEPGDESASKENAENSNKKSGSKTAKASDSAKNTNSTVDINSFSKSDQHNLEITLCYIIGYGCDWETGDISYNSSSKTALKDAIGLSTALFFESLFEALCYNGVYNYSVFDYNSSYMSFYSNGEDSSSVIKDPLNKCKEENGNYYYKRIDENVFDEILVNIFNVQPDHSFVFNGYYNEYLKHIVYNYEGYYYLTCEDGGDVAGPATYIDKIELQSDGRYLIQITEKWGSYEGEVKTIGKYSVECKLNTESYRGYWTIYKITKI